MTIDCSNDAQIQVSGIANYSLSDQDGGEPGDDSELEAADVEDDDEAGVPEEEDSENDDDVCGVRKRKESSGAGGAAGGAQEEEEEEEELWSNDDDERADSCETQLMLPPWLQSLVQLVRLMVLRLLGSVPSLTCRAGQSSTN